MSGVREGGCLCGAVRYTAAWPPLAVATCSCVDCQKQSGSAISILAVLPRGGLTVRGELKVFEGRSEGDRPVYRKFCGACGSPVVTDTPGAEAGELIFIKLGTLDDRSGLVPTVHYWTRSAQSWLDVGPGERLKTQ